MESRVIKIIRWILLFPLTFAVPMFVHLYLTDKVGVYSITIHASWYSILGLTPLVTLWFIPALLTIPTACAITPAHQKKVSIITLIVVASFWLAVSVILSLPAISTVVSQPLPRSNVVSIVALCSQLLGLLTGFLIVRSALKKRERGEPFLKSSAIAIILIICLVCIPLRFPKGLFFKTEFSELTWKEDAGVVSYSFKLENRTGKKNDIAVELIVASDRDSAKNIDAATPPLGKIHIDVSLAPKETRTITGQFPAEGSVILLPILTKPNLPTTSSSQ